MRTSCVFIGPLAFGCSWSFGSCHCPCFRAVTTVASLCLLAFALQGCTLRIGGSTSLDGVIYDLRHRQVELTERCEKLERENDRLEDQVNALGQQITRQVHVEGGNPADLPQVVTLKFGRLSGARDTDDDGVDDAVWIYLRTLDQRDRMLPVSGRLWVQVLSLAAAEDPAVLAKKQFEPDDLDRCFHSDLTGTHYTIKLPFQSRATSPVVTVAVTLLDASTGVTIEHEQEVPVSVGGVTGQSVDHSGL